MAAQLARMVEAAAPGIFVVLWSTGFIGARLGLPYAEPFTFLALRFALTLAILAPFVILLARGPHSRVALFHSAVTGVLIHGFYLGGVFFAIDRGMPAGVSALTIAIQPLLTVFVARLVLGERATARQLAGLVLALGGVLLVLAPGVVGGAAAQGVNAVTIAASVAAVLGICLGTVYQKRHGAGLDLRVSALAQYAGALVPVTLLALLTETGRVAWTGEFVFAMAWLILVLSIGAVLLLMFLIRRDSAAATASLFYLVPVSTALIAWAMFGETLQPAQLAGMAVVIFALAWSGRAKSGRAKSA